jgi:putative phosphoesterase
MEGDMKKSQTVGIISDTHDNRTAIRQAVEIFNSRGAALVIHAGDLVAPFTALDFKALNCPMEMVFGNNDGEKIGLSSSFKEIGNILPGPRTFTFQGKKFLLMHEQGSLEALAGSGNVDVIIYGHTHEIDIRKGPPLIINPGEAGGWLRDKSTIALLDLETMAVEVIELKC